MHVQQLSSFLKQASVLVPGLENLITDYKKPVVFMLALESKAGYLGCLFAYH